MEEAEAIKMIESEQNTIKRLEQDKILMAESRKADIEKNPIQKMKKISKSK
jgi:hypothetical protein